MKNLGKNVGSNLHNGAQKCSIVGECRDAFDGIAQGSFKKATLNAALVTPYLASLGGASSGFKVGINSATK